MIPILSPLLQKRRHEAVKPFLRGDILDLGCGHAEIISLLSEHQTYVGVEGDPDIFNWLKSNFPGFEFYLRDLNWDELNLNRIFDTILMVAIIEHIVNPSFVLSQIPSLLKSDGLLVLTTPTILGDKVHRFGARLGLFSMIAVRDHVRIYDYHSLHTLMKNNGLDIKQYKKFMFGGNQVCLCSPSSNYSNLDRPIKL
jgi:SAM-dependent methyltransferase